MNPVIRDVALALGFPQYQLRKWKLRKAVPHKHRFPIFAAAQKKGESLSFADFEFANRKQKAAKPKRKRAA